MRNSIIKLGIIIAILNLVIGCKKYGFNIADGYDKDTLAENVTVDTSDSKPDYSMLNQAKIFPGIVDPSEPRLQKYQVTLNMNYLDESKSNRLRISNPPQPIFCTGTYAAPGESITIVLPDNAKGLSCQIGMWTDDLSNISPLLRSPIIYTVKQLFPGINHVRNLFGGNIYIQASFPILQPVALSISGACKSPDFTVGTTDPATWKKEILTTEVPWFDFYSNSIDFTLPTAKMKAYLQSGGVDPIAELKEWDSVLRYDYQEWIGLSDTASSSVDKMQTLPQRIVLDIQPSVGYGHSGYPVVATDDDEWFGAAMDVTSLMQGSSEWGTLHEMGHNYQQGNYWVWGGIIETSNNLHSFKRALRMGINRSSLRSTFPDEVAEAITYAESTNSNKDIDKDIDESQGDGPFQKMVPFLQMLDKEGWGFFGYLNKRARHAQYVSNSDIDRHDFLYEAISEYAHKDYYKFFQAWGIQLSNQARNQIGEEYPAKLATQIWKYNPVTYAGGDDSIDYTISRSDWTITSQTPGDAKNDDEELTGEATTSAPKNGQFSSALDDDETTYWHSRWSSDETPYPHILVFDMQQANVVSDIYFVQRAFGSRNVKSVDIYVGNDLNSLQPVVTNAILAENSDVQKINLPSSQLVRYFKVVFNSAYDGGPNAAMAEIGIN